MYLRAKQAETTVAVMGLRSRYRADNTLLFGRRTYATFRLLVALPTQAAIVVSRWFTDYWLAYHEELPARIHQVGNVQTQSIEGKHLDSRTRVKRLARRTICFPKSVMMHDTVIG